MISTATAGGTVINYSDHFTITGMTGTFSTNVKTGLASLSGTAGPDTVNDVSSGDTASAAVSGDVFTVPYYLQTGLIKYAPMQPIPPTKITAKSQSMLNPTSAFTIATTWMKQPSVTLTVTESQTFSASSIENTAAAASQPTGDMAKFLARWKD
ncbi:Cell wall synthesis protein kre9 precursor [Zalaria obscura]|uniref:Cell wall synthesis protein kre9 n=1 Tax=Zalaria obscura TaxID=2024903 RepID=A0ACC3SDQ8_9PEZI